MKKKKLKPKPIVMVTWEDACSFISTPLKDVLKENTDVNTFGVLIHKDKKLTVIMTHDGKEEGCCDYLRIPSSLVRKIVKLKEG